MNDKVLNMRISAKLYEQLKKTAEEKGISMAALVRLICSEYLKEK